MTAKEATQVMARLAASYPHYELEATTVAVYAEMLSDIAFDDADLAVRQHVASSRMFPSISEIRGLVAERRLGLPSPYDAWGQVQFAVAEGATGDLAEPVRAALRLIGGSWALRTTDEPEFLRSQFVKAYAEARAQAIAAVQVEPVAPALAAAPEQRELTA